MTIHLQDEVTVFVPSLWLKQAKQTKQCLYCLAVLAVYHEQKYTVSQHLKIVSSLDPLGHSVLPVQYMYVKDGGHLVVVAKWQSTGGSSQRCPGFDSWRLPAFSLFSIFTHNMQIFAGYNTMVVLKPDTSLVDVTCCLDM